MNYKKWFIVGLVIQVAILYPWLTSVTTSGYSVLAVLVAWTASPILFLTWAILLESKSVQDGGRGETFPAVFWSVFSHKKQAWSFLYGDTILLPFAFLIVADKWGQIGDRSSMTPSWWWWLSLALGIAAGAGFHYKVDKPGYTQRGYAASLHSPTKLFHDFVSYPVLFGGLLYSFGPLFITSWFNLHTILVLVLVAVWFCLGAKLDNDRANELVPWGHPLHKWDSLAFMGAIRKN